MTGHNRVLVRPWKLVTAVVVLGTHIVFLHRVRHAGVSLTVMAGLVVLLIGKHIGVFGSLYGLLRRRNWK